MSYHIMYHIISYHLTSHTTLLSLVEHNVRLSETRKVSLVLCSICTVCCVSCFRGVSVVLSALPNTPRTRGSPVPEGRIPWAGYLAQAAETCDFFSRLYSLGRIPCPGSPHIKTRTTRKPSPTARPAQPGRRASSMDHCELRRCAGRRELQLDASQVLV